MYRPTPYQKHIIVNRTSVRLSKEWHAQHEALDMDLWTRVRELSEFAAVFEDCVLDKLRMRTSTDERLNYSELQELFGG